MEQLYTDGLIRKMDIEAVYEGLFLRAVTNFESYLEELFMDVLLGRTKHSKTRAKSLIKVSNKSILQEIILQGRLYNDWLPYDRTESRARLYLRDGKPFSGLTDQDRALLKNITLIRNAIAHKSEHAFSQFERKVLSSLPLLRGEKVPAGFLRSQFRANPKQVRFEVYLAELGRIAASLS